MSASDIFLDIAEKNDWDEAEQVDILLEYIENQKSPEAFYDFLRMQGV